jgi:6-pyruvoyltetrahydropterin/6-carboxytetrahydropterin synthase
MVYITSKTYGHNLGLSVCFRQHKARSHCRHLHGYALEIRLEFETNVLDEAGWVVDFGGLRSFKNWLEDTFDHKLLVAEDDPYIGIFQNLRLDDLVDIVVVPATGCEAFAKLIYESGVLWLLDNDYSPRVRMRSVEVREHGANSAIYNGNGI